MSAADHEAAIREAIEALCEDSLEVPLSQLLNADPKYDGQQGATFRRLVGEVDALVGLLQQAEQDLENLEALRQSLRTLLADALARAERAEQERDVALKMMGAERPPTLFRAGADTGDTT